MDLKVLHVVFMGMSSLLAEGFCLWEVFGEKKRKVYRNFDGKFFCVLFLTDCAFGEELTSHKKSFF